MTGAIQTALSGLQSAATRISASASNIANAGTVGSLTDANNAPYTPQTTTSTALGDTGGVQTQIVPQQPAFTPSFDPGSPFADADGFIGTPNVDLASEIVNLKLAEISYKANISVVETAGELIDSLLDIDKNA